MMNGLRREIAGDIEGMHVNLQEDISGMDERIRYLNTQSESSLQASRDSFEAVATRIEQRVDGSERKTARKMQDLAQTVSNAAASTQALMDEQSSRMNSRMVRTSANPASPLRSHARRLAASVCRLCTGHTHTHNYTLPGREA